MGGRINLDFGGVDDGVGGCRNWLPRGVVAWNAGTARCAGLLVGNVAWFMLCIDVSEIASGSRVAVVKILPFQSVG